VNIEEKLKTLLNESLPLPNGFWRETNPELLDRVPELDSVNVLTILLKIEETFDVVIADDALDAESFRDFNALLALVNNALEAP
jgi:acyl carrier protein